MMTEPLVYPHMVSKSDADLVDSFQVICTSQAQETDKNMDVITVPLPSPKKVT